MRPLDCDAADVVADEAEHADDDEIERDDVVQEPRHEENQEARDQRHERRDGNAQHHGYLRPLAESCMSRPACSTDWPALSSARSACRPARSAGPPLPCDASRLQAATTANSAAMATRDFTRLFVQ